MYKVYVGCLPASCTPEQLSEFFSTFGPIVDPKISRKPGSKLCSGNGTFGCLDKKNFDAIITERQFDFHGRTIFCEGKLTGEELLIKNQILSRRRIFVSNLPATASDQQIEEVMRVFGPVQNGYRIKTLSNKPRPFGFVTFHHEETARKAVSVGFILINEQIVYITPFKKNNLRKGKEASELPGSGNSKLCNTNKSVQLLPPNLTGRKTYCSRPSQQSKYLEALQAAQHIKPTSVRYHQRGRGLDHRAFIIRFNIQVPLMTPPTHPVVSTKNQTMTTIK